MADKLTQGAVVAVIGILTVFVVLAILWGVLELMHLIFAPKTKKTAKPAAAPTQAPAPAVAPAPAPAAADDDELIAVLTAAVAACLGQPTNGLKITSYRRVMTAPVWNQTARRDNLNG